MTCDKYTLSGGLNAFFCLWKLCLLNTHMIDSPCIFIASEFGSCKQQSKLQEIIYCNFTTMAKSTPLFSTAHFQRQAQQRAPFVTPVYATFPWDRSSSTYLKCLNAGSSQGTALLSYQQSRMSTGHTMRDKWGLLRRARRTPSVPSVW